MEEAKEAERKWITLGDFARQLGIARASVYGRIKRGTLEAKRGNRGGYLVQWPPPGHDGSSDAAGDVGLRSHNQSRESSATVVGDVAVLRAEVAQLEERLAAAERARDELQERTIELRMALARVETKAESITDVARGEIKAAKRIAAAEVESMREQLASGVAARNAVIEELRAMLAEARRPWWRRWLGK